MYVVQWMLRLIILTQIIAIAKASPQIRILLRILAFAGNADTEMRYILLHPRVYQLKLLLTSHFTSHFLSYKQSFLIWPQFYFALSERLRNYIRHPNLCYIFLNFCQLILFGLHFDNLIL